MTAESQRASSSTSFIIIKFNSKAVTDRGNQLKLLPEMVVAINKKKKKKLMKNKNCAFLPNMQKGIFSALCHKNNKLSFIDS